MAIPRIFVSHNHQDTPFCREYVNELRGRGFQVWYDEHNLGWGALRATIEREMPQCQHFVAILSPTAVASEWVNTEIDAALELLQEGTLQTFTFVIAERCTVPLLLRRWKRIEGPGGAPVSVAEAVARTAAIIAPPTSTVASVPSTTPAPARTAPQPTPPALPPEQFPSRLASLGFEARKKDGVAYIVPPLCSMPAGEFLMGSDKRRDSQAYDNELPQHRVNLPAFQIARFPVTVAEYACFVRAGQKEPSDWQSQLGKLDHPVVYVSWRDAVAYAAWLAKTTGQPWRLPSEAEWEKAARWDAARQVSRLYPWGDTFDTVRCNTYGGGKGGTTPVGSYGEKGASPCGAQEMAGNVWEWTSSLFKPYPYSVSDGREDRDSTESRVLRGGSWHNNARFARVAFRDHSHPDLLSGNFGFR